MSNSPIVTDIVIGASSCLLGEEVRYNGRHKRDRFVTETLARFVTLVGVCPEVGCGLPVPRQTMHLTGEPADPRLTVISTGQDLTAPMRDFCQATVQQLEEKGLSGFIFKSRSPSCGLFQVIVHGGRTGDRPGRGLFADAMARHFPLMPMEEEGRLHNAGIRRNFIGRVHAYRRWQDFLAGGQENLVEFHSTHKYLIMAHSPELYRQMGRLVAERVNDEGVLAQYGQLLMRALSSQDSVGNQVNVLMHIMGYFKKQLSKVEKAEFLQVLDQYRSGIVSVVVPLTLLRHYAVSFDNQYLQRQVYLKPSPLELMLESQS